MVRGSCPSTTLNFGSVRVFLVTTAFTPLKVSRTRTSTSHHQPSVSPASNIVVMEEANSSEWNDWKTQPDPIMTLSKELTVEQFAEVCFFVRQRRLQLATRQRREAFEDVITLARERFEEQVRLDRAKFERAESHKQMDILCSFGHKIWVSSLRAGGMSC